MHIRAIIAPSGAGKSHFFKDMTGQFPELIDLDEHPMAHAIYEDARARGGDEWWNDHKILMRKDFAFARLLDHLKQGNEVYTVLTAEPTFCFAEITVGVVPLATDLLQNMRRRNTTGPTLRPLHSTIEQAIDAVEQYKALFYSRKMDTASTVEDAFQMIKTRLQHALFTTPTSAL